MKPLLIEDIMTRNVVSMQASHSIHLTAGVMELKHIRHVPVVDGDRLVGLITHRDLLRAHSALLAQPYDPRHDDSLSIPIAQIMRTNVWTVRPDTPVLEAARICLDHKFGCLPVVDGGKLVGIVSEIDFIRCLVDGLSARRRESPASTSSI